MRFKSQNGALFIGTAPSQAVDPMGERIQVFSTGILVTHNAITFNSAFSPIMYRPRRGYRGVDDALDVILVLLRIEYATCYEKGLR